MNLLHQHSIEKIETIREVFQSVNESNINKLDAQKA